MNVRYHHLSKGLRLINNFLPYFICLLLLTQIIFFIYFTLYIKNGEANYTYLIPDIKRPFSIDFLLSLICLNQAVIALELRDIKLIRKGYFIIFGVLHFLICYCIYHKITLLIPLLGSELTAEQRECLPEINIKTVFLFYVTYSIFLFGILVASSFFNKYPWRR